MKYYILARNTETGKTMVMTVPVFTNRKKAQKWADDFVKSFGTSVAEATVIREDER